MNYEPIHVSKDIAHTGYMLAWLSFALSHSWLAGVSMRRRMATVFGPARRLAYNIIAAVHLFAVFGFGAWAFAGLPRFRLQGWDWTFMTVMAVSGWALVFLVLRTYDLGKFSGLEQIRAAQTGAAMVVDDEALKTNGFHAYVRHPLYGAVFLVLWGAAWNDFGLVTAVWGSGYLVIGSRFEERRLQRLHGDAYRTYRKRVPVFFPYRGKVIK